MVKFCRQAPVEKAETRAASRQLVVVFGVAAMLAGCADAGSGEAPWWRSGLAGSVTGLFGPDRPGTEPPPADGRPFPNLASVPRPPPPISAAVRQAEMAELAAERDAAQALDARLRDGLGANVEALALPRTTVVMGAIDLDRAWDATDEAVLDSAYRLAAAEQGRVRLIDGPAGSGQPAEGGALARLRQDLARRGLPADRLVVEARGRRPLVLVEY